MPFVICERIQNQDWFARLLLLDLSDVVKREGTVAIGKRGCFCPQAETGYTNLDGRECPLLSQSDDIWR